MVFKFLIIIDYLETNILFYKQPGMIETVLRALKTRKVRITDKFPRESIKIVQYLKNTSKILTFLFQYDLIKFLILTRE